MKERLPAFVRTSQLPIEPGAALPPSFLSKREERPSIVRSARLWVGTATAASCLAYLCVVSATLVAMRLGGDEWWFGTVLLYSPRIFIGLPLVVLAPAAFLLHRRSLAILLVAALLWVGPLMGFCLAWGRTSLPEHERVRVLTCNVDQLGADPDGIVRLIRDHGVDVVLLQECSAELKVPWPPNWHSQRAGQLLVASKYPIKSAETSRRMLPRSEWPPINGLHAVLETPNGPLSVACIHLMTPRIGLSTVLDRHTLVRPSRAGTLLQELEDRRSESAEMFRWLLGFSPDTIIGGDFNMPVDSRIFKAYWSGYTDGFSAAGRGFGHTKFETVGLVTYGIRIDHVLTASDWQPAECWVGPDIGSDHRPLIVELIRKRRKNLVP